MNYSQMLYEEFTLKLEVSNLSDSDLADEVSFILITCENDQIDDILDRFFKIGTFTPIDRKYVEEFYILNYRECLWEE